MRRIRKQIRKGGRAHALLLATAIVIGLPAVASAAPPDNDDVDAAVVIDVIPFYGVTTYTNEATVAADDPSCLGGARTVWYSYTPAEDIRIDANTFGSNYDTTLGVYTGTRGSLTQIACNDDAYGYKQSSVRFAATAGTTYYILGGSLAQGTHGTFKLTMTEAPGPPDNDTLQGALDITRLPYETSMDAREATTGTDDGDCFGKANTVWFRYESGKDQKIEADTAGSYYDTTLAVYKRSGSDLKRLACVDNLKGSALARTTFEAKAGTTYLFRIGSASEYGADLLRFRVAVVPPPLKLSVTISDEASTSAVTGIATVSGRITCSRRVDLSLSGNLRQRNGDKVISASFRKTLTCKKATAWKVQVDGGRMAFVEGAARVKVTVESRSDRIDDSAAKVVLL